MLYMFSNLCCTICLYSGFKVSVLAKLDTINENQCEQLELLRHVTANSQSSGLPDLEELLASKIDTVEDLMAFDDKLLVAEYRKKMVSS